MAELIWEGKYDQKGRRISPLRVSLPFQTVETVNESVQERQRALDLFAAGRDLDWRNRLIWGDKKYVLSALLDEFAERVDLVYVDPPFATGQDFSRTIEIEGEEFVKQPSVIEMKAYRDTWGEGLDTYIDWFYQMAVTLHELLTETGSLYVHLDYGVSHPAKLVLDEVFGADNFRNEITWKRFTFHADAKRFGRITDRILFYSKTSDFKFHQLKAPFAEEYIADKFTHVDESGRRFRLSDLNPPGNRGPVYEFHGQQGCTTQAIPRRA
jgi:adenine specific DNA methylase Mod